MPNTVKRAVYSVLDAARHLGVSRTQVYRLLANGSLDILKIGSRRSIRRFAVDTLLERFSARFRQNTERI